MSRNPRLTGPELIVVLGRAGFAVARIRGSHHFLVTRTAGTPLYPYIPGTQSARDC